MRQALAGMLWSKQYYDYDVDRWLDGARHDPFKLAQARARRNDDWFHMDNDDVISMPDKWEYPWYAAWDLAFHCIALHAGGSRLRQAAARPDAAATATCTPTARSPPTSGTSATSTRRCTPGRRSSSTGWRRRRRGQGDVDCSSACFQKLLLNFTWWVNRKDRTGSNVFEGGFLGPGQHRRLRPQRAAARPAATSSRPTAPPGWRSSARTCSRSPSSWR